MERNLFSREIIKDERFVKAEIKKDRIELSGISEKVVGHIQDKGVALFKRLKDENLSWINKKRESFGAYLEEIDWKEVEAEYKKGLLRYIKAHCRFFRKCGSSIEDIENEFDESALEEIIGSYTFDFIRSLRISRRLDISPKTALEIAELSYRHNPDILLILSQEFPEFEQWIITRAAVGYPTNPEGFLQNMRKQILELQQEFPDIEEGVISYVAVYNPTNPKGFLQNMRKQILELQQEFPEFKQGIITHAAVGYHTNPKGFLQNMRKQILELQQEFPDIEEGVISHAAVHSPSDVKGFLKDFQKRIINLTEQFPNSPKSEIKRAAVSYPRSAEDYLKKYKTPKSDVI